MRREALEGYRLCTCLQQRTARGCWNADGRGRSVGRGALWVLAHVYAARTHSRSINAISSQPSCRPEDCCASLSQQGGHVKQVKIGSLAPSELFSVQRRSIQGGAIYKEKVTFRTLRSTHGAK